MLKVGYQGQIGSNSEAAAKILADRMEIGATLVPLLTSENVCLALESNQIDYGVCAVKNNIGGIVEETRKAFENRNVSKLLFCQNPVHHCLFVHPTAEITTCTTVASHPQALKQTTKTRFEKYPWLKPFEAPDTSIAAEYISNGTYNTSIAALCLKSAGEHFGLKLIEENLEDKPSMTEFWIFKLKENN